MYMTFIDPKLKRAVPYGVYDIRNNTGWVSVGTDHDTAAFAVNAIRRWWRTMGKKRYPNPKGLLVTADGGGCNGYRVRLWKIELPQKLANELKVPITVCHLPPGPASGIKSSTGSFFHHASTGAASHCAVSHHRRTDRDYYHQPA